MRLTNYWWLLIWLFGAGGFLYYFFPRQQVISCAEKEERWQWLPAVVLCAPYVIWAAYREWFGDSLLSSKLQKNISEKWRISKNATFSDFIEGSFL